MKKYLTSGLILFAICAFFALLLSLVNLLTAPTIKRNAEREVLEGLNIVNLENGIVDMDTGEKQVESESVNSYYIVRSVDGSVLGYILNLTGKGYGGNFTLLSSYQKDGTLYRAKLLENNETSGIGKKYEEDENIAIFSSYGDIPLSKSSLLSEHSAIVSGASITFGGIGNALKDGQTFVRDVLGRM